MSGQSRYHRAKADELLAQLPPDDADMPVPTIHLSYYAMWHAAFAVLWHVHGTASQNHGRLHAAFQSLVRARAGAETAGLETALERAYEMRRRADYDTDPSLSDLQQDAREIGPLRDRVLGFCDRILNAAE